MAKTSIELRVKIAWWVVAYTKMLCFFCDVTGMEPDVSKYKKRIAAGIKVIT